MGDLVKLKNSDWLRTRRGLFCAQSSRASNRNSLTAGRTGTRCNIGRPQTRWEAGIALARGYVGSRKEHVRGSNRLSVGSRIRAAAQRLREVFTNPP